MIWEDSALLVELARLNTDMPSLVLQIMKSRASATEQQRFAQRLLAAGHRLQRRAEGMQCTTIEEDTTVDQRIALPSSYVVDRAVLLVGSWASDRDPLPPAGHGPSGQGRPGPRRRGAA